MSKSEAPAPPGAPTHGPKISVKGVTGAAARGKAISKYEGALLQFLRGQQQYVKLGELKQHSATRVLGAGVRVHYHNSNGHEQVTLEVPPEGGGHEEITEEHDEYWKWAIVEMRVPGIQGLTSFVASAFLNPKDKNKVGVALNKTYPYDDPRPPLSYPIDTLGTFIGDVQDNDGYASLRVDLRPYPGGVKFDLYGYIRRYQDGTTKGAPTGANRTMWRGANNVPDGSGSYNTLGGATSSFWFSPSAISGRTQTNYIYKATGTPRTTLADIAASFPSIAGPFSTGSIPAGYGASWSGNGPTYGGLGITWTPGSGNCPDATTMNIGAIISAAGGIFTETTTTLPDGFSKIVRGIGAQTNVGSTATGGAGPVDADGTWGITFFDYTIYYVGIHPDVPNYVYPAKDCPISFVVLDDGPDGMTNRYGSPLRMNSYRWESTKKYPARWPMKQLPDLAHMPAIDDTGIFGVATQAQHYGMTKLGTVIINPKKGKGGIKFIAA